MKELLLCIFFACSITISNACDCQGFTVKELYEGVPVVIEGRVHKKELEERTSRIFLNGDSVNYTLPFEIITFEVINVYKGEIKSLEYIQVAIDISSTCGVDYELAETHYVFIAKAVNTYFTDQCMIPIDLNKNSRGELLELSRDSK
jgi:hypothetical protein